MSRLALAYLTKDRVELTNQTLPRIINDDIEVFWVDGSRTDEGVTLAGLECGQHGFKWFPDVRGGPDAAIVYALDLMLKSSDCNYIGIMENDVLLHPDWLGPTMALFERGASEGLRVGAVSPRCYEDRILLQRDGYAVMHNLGAGIIIFDRQAAALLLCYQYRTTYSLENRQAFMKLCGLDIGRWWAFRGESRWLTADWGFDKTLALYGYASLALVPSPVEMIGQTPSLDEQGLKIAKQPVELLRNDGAFAAYAMRQRRIRDGEWVPGQLRHARNQESGETLIFPHQVFDIDARYEGDWRLRWSQGFGPFTWIAGEPGASLLVDVAGPCDFLVGGGHNGGQWHLQDITSNYTVAPTLQPEGPSGQIMQLPVPASVSYRTVVLTARSAGVAFYGLHVREPQPTITSLFGYEKLPRPAE